MKKKKLPFKDQFTKLFLEQAGIVADEENIKKYRSIFWYNIRDTKLGGLRLTDKGIEFVRDRAQISIHSIELPKNSKITLQLFLWIDRSFDTPYHLDHRSISVLSEKAAIELYLYSVDLKKYGYAKSIIKRLKDI